MPRILKRKSTAGSRLGSADPISEELADGKEIIINPEEISDTPEEPDPYAANPVPGENTGSANDSLLNAEEDSENLDLSSVSDEELLEEVRRRGLVVQNHDEKDAGNDPVFTLSLYNLEGKKKTFWCESELSARRMFADYAAKVPAIYSRVALGYEAGVNSRIVSEFPSESNKEIVGEPKGQEKPKVMLVRKKKSS